jgi:hypothetical protein
VKEDFRDGSLRCFRAEASRVQCRIKPPGGTNARRKPCEKKTVTSL